MSEFMNIVLLSVAMFVGCMVAGYVPLMFSLSQKSIQRCTILGAGLLVGTALAVIIPEGVEVMYNGPHDHSNSNDLNEKQDGSTKIGESFLHRNIKNVVPPEKESLETINLHHDYYHQHTHAEEGKENIHRAVGASLLFGFIFMLLVDQCGGSHMHSHDAADVSNPNKPAKSGKSLTATLGLVVHAAADGIALGAAANTSKTDLQLIVFMAIMLHKAPAAFGLVSFLLHESIEKRRIKQYLLVFALAAPVLAILTFLQLNQLQKGNYNLNFNGTGVAMLFSGGTFLYVSTVHVLPEVSHSNGLSRQDVLFLLIGAILPLILSLTHSH